MKYTCILLLIFILVGCQKFYTINVTKKDGKIVFGSEMLASHCKKSIYIYDFEVKYRNNKVTDTAWMIVRNKRPSSGYTAFDFPLVYGESITGVSTRTEAIEILPGVYKLGATISCLTESDSESRSLLGSFAIGINGELITDKEKILSMENLSQI